MPTTIGSVHGQRRQAEDRRETVPRPLRIMGLLMTLVVGMLLAPVVSEAQPRTTIPRVGVLSHDTPQRANDTDGCVNLLRHGLRGLGYVEGHTIFFDYRYAERKPEQFPLLAAELVQLAPDVIWTYSSRMAAVAKQAITTIPV